MAPEIIVPDGDLLFEVGIPGRDGSGEIKVSSAVLRRSCRAFADILDGELSGTAQKPKTITLPDDQHGEMVDLCLMLHGMTPPNITTASSKRILDLAVAVHKYECLSQLQLQAQAILYQVLADLKYEEEGEEDDYAV